MISLQRGGFGRPYERFETTPLSGNSAPTERLVSFDIENWRAVPFDTEAHLPATS